MRLLIKHRVQDWWHKRSETFSRCAGDDITNGEVVLTNVAIIVIIAACGFAEWIGGL